jgi:hypothetical protein
MKTRMRRLTAIATAAATVVGLAAATPSMARQTSGATLITQTETETYYLPTYETVANVGDVLHVGGGAFDAPSWARYFSVEVTDATGLPTAGYIQLAWYWGWPGPRVADFCGRTTESHPIDTSTYHALWVDLEQGPCDDGTLAGGTTGTISVTFTN